MNKFIGVLETKETIESNAVMEVEGFKDSTYKFRERVIKFYRNKNVITCVIKTDGSRFKAIGFARCNPKDGFDYSTGIILSELRARENLYKGIVERHVERMRSYEDALRF